MTTTTTSIAMSMGSNVLVDGKLLSGSELTDYAKKKGLCPKCVQQVTHKRLKKRLGMIRSEWIPITVKDTQARNYIVYKGYCIQPTCHTLSEAKALLGEASSFRSKSAGRTRESSKDEFERAKSVSRSRNENDSLIQLASLNHRSERRLISNIRSTSTYHSERHLNIKAVDRQDVSILRGMVRRRVDKVTGDEGKISPSSRSVDYDEISLGSACTTDSGNFSTCSKASVLSKIQAKDKNRLEKQSSNISDSSERSSSRRRRTIQVDDNVLESTHDVHGTTRNAMRSSMFYRQPSIGSDIENDDLELEKSSTVEELLSPAPNKFIRSARRLSVETVNVSNRNIKNQPVEKSQRRASISYLPQNSPLLKRKTLSTARFATSSRDIRLQNDINENLSQSNYSWSRDGNGSSSVVEKDVSETLVYTAGAGTANIQPQPTESTRRRASISYLPQKAPLLQRKSVSTGRSTRDLSHQNDMNKQSDFDKPIEIVGRDKFSQSKYSSSMDVPDSPSNIEQRTLTALIHPASTGRCTSNIQSQVTGSTRRRASISCLPLKSPTSNRRTWSKGQCTASTLDICRQNDLKKLIELDKNDEALNGDVCSSITSLSREIRGERSLTHSPSGVSTSSIEFNPNGVICRNAKSCDNLSPRRNSLSIPYSENDDISNNGDSISSNDGSSAVVVDRSVAINSTQSTIIPQTSLTPPTKGAETGRLISDMNILEQLCSLVVGKSKIYGLESASVPTTDHLWASLHTRYGDETSSLNTYSGKISSLLNLLATTGKDECCDKCWSLICYLCKLENAKDHNVITELGLLIAERTRAEFNRNNFDGDAKLLAAATLFHIIKIEQTMFEKKITVWIHSMAESVILKWVAVLCDVLNFQDVNQSAHQKEIADVLQLICYLLDNEVAKDTDASDNFKNQSMKSLFEISISILSLDPFDSQCLMSSNDQDQENYPTSRLCEGALHMLASALSRNTIATAKGRQIELFRLILAAMNKYASHGVLYRGLLASRQVLSTCKAADNFSEGIYDNVTSSILAADKVTEMAYISILFEQRNPNHRLNIECISVISQLFETNDTTRYIAEKSVILRKPMIVEAILRLIDACDDFMIVDKACFLMLFHITKNPTSAINIRQTKSFSSKVVGWLHKYQGNVSIQEYICLTIEYLAYFDESSFGEEVCCAGGATTLSNMIKSSVRGDTWLIVPPASRALLAVLSAAQNSCLSEFSVTVKDDVVDAMKSDYANLELQLAALHILVCIYMQSTATKGLCDGVLPVIVHVMEIYFENQSLITKCCSIIRKVSSYSDPLNDAIETEALKKVVNSLLAHPTATELVLEGMATLKDLAVKGELRAIFNFDDAEVAIVSIFPIYTRNPDFISLAFETINNIAVHPYNRNVAQMQIDVLDYIASALSKFPGNPDVVKSACLLLERYSCNEINLEMIRSFGKLIKPLLFELSENHNVEIRECAQHINRII